MKTKIIIRQHPLVKDWEVTWKIAKDKWKRKIFKTKQKANRFASLVKKAEKVRSLVKEKECSFCGRYKKDCKCP